MWCGKLRVTVWFVNRHLTVCVVWKTSGHRVYHHLIFCVSSTDIVCGVENFVSPCVPSFDILCFVNRHCVWCGNLQFTVCTIIWHHRSPCKTYSQNTFRKHDINIIIFYVKLIRFLNMILFLCLQTFYFLLFPLLLLIILIFSSIIILLSLLFLNRK